MDNEISRSWIEVDLRALSYNINQLCRLLPDRNHFMAVVKADGYGHGAVKVAAHCQNLGIKAFAVATIDEGIMLRKSGISGDILILGYTHPQRANQLYRYRLIQTIIDLKYAKMLEQEGWDLAVHLKIDTGMHRLGFALDDYESIDEIYDYQHLDVKGVFSHLCVCDSDRLKDIEFTKGQINNFFNFIDNLKKKGKNVGKIHLQSSFGLINYPDIKCDYARIGILMYGVNSSLDDYQKNKLALKPVLSIKTRIAMIHNLKRNESLGYGRTYTVDCDSKIAIVPIGYGDGIPRELSSNGKVLIRGIKCPIVGRVCMDQMLIDVSEIDNLGEDEIVTIIGRDGDNEVKVEEVAAAAHTISNEILSRLGSRLVRRYLK